MWTHRRSGQSNQRGLDDHRLPYERDRTRVIHCPAFRRLQRKTQIHGTDEGDFHRTRLTHSLEVASIGLSIARNLAITQNKTFIESLIPNDDLITTVCLLHDIGHPPFGHGGEVALNFMMRDHGGFEGNGQTLRLLTKLETSYGSFGLDLTRRSLLGLLKYPVSYRRVLAPEKPLLPELGYKSIRINDWLPPKSYFDSEQAEVDWLLSPFSDEEKTLLQSLKKEPKGKQHGSSAYASFDCSLMNIADDIAYAVHDLEDAIHLHLIPREQLESQTFSRLMQECLGLREESFSLESFLQALFSLERSERKQSIGELVNYFIAACFIDVSNEVFTTDLFRYRVFLRPEALELLNYLKQAIFSQVIDSQASRIFEHGGQCTVIGLFQALSSDPNGLLDNKHRLLFNQAVDEMSAQRIICDYIANMTDEYASRFYQRLTGFKQEKNFLL